MLSACKADIAPRAAVKNRKLPGANALHSEAHGFCRRSRRTRSSFEQRKSAQADPSWCRSRTTGSALSCGMACPSSPGEGTGVAGREARAVHNRYGDMLWSQSFWTSICGSGHTAKLMPPEYVKCYVKAQKNDDRDAEGIVDAATRPMMRFVTLRSGEQLDIQSLHHTSDRLVGERTGLYRMAVTRSGSVFDALWVAA